METSLAELFQELDQGSAGAETSLVSSSPARSPQPTQVISRKKSKLSIAEQREQTIKNIESELLRDSMEVVNDTLRFREITPGQDEPPPAWVREVGQKRAVERLRVANAGWMSKKDAPIAVQLAQVVAVGIIRSRATEKAGPKTFNVAMVQMSAPLPTFPELDVTGSDK